MRQLMFATAAMAAVFTAPATASAAEYDDALKALCEKTKACAIEQMQGVENMNEATRAMVMQSLEGMCVGLMQSYALAITYPDLTTAAAACMRSMTDLSCEALQAGSDSQTAECATFREKAKAYE